MGQVHAFIRRFVSEADFRRLALSNPSAALSSYHLTTAERDSLTRLCARVSSQGAAAAQAGPTEYWL